ncbi:PELP1 protein, partial [Alaudala cheleensis]|nr:PELP1 protein [Alaudala cheleensis]
WGSLLCRLFPQVLSSWSGPREQPPGQERPFGAVRSRLYQVLELWVQGEVFGALRVEPKPSAPKRPKLGEGPEGPPLHRKGEPAANSDTCAAALAGREPKSPQFTPKTAPKWSGEPKNPPHNPK